MGAISASALIAVAVAGAKQCSKVAEHDVVAVGHSVPAEFKQIPSEAKPLTQLGEVARPAVQSSEETHDSAKELGKEAGKEILKEGLKSSAEGDDTQSEAK